MRRLKEIVHFLVILGSAKRYAPHLWGKQYCVSPVDADGNSVKKDNNDCVRIEGKSNRFTGYEKVLAIKVQDEGTVARAYFDTVDELLGDKNHINVLFNGKILTNSKVPYEATYSGAETSYWRKKSDLTIHWNCITRPASDGGGLVCFWEGDPVACGGNGSDEGIETTIPQVKWSNQFCTQKGALEYCHRHGGELMLPDEYFWQFFIKGMCTGEEGFPDLSQQEYWLNWRREKEDLPKSEDKFSFSTTASFHSFGNLDPENRYIGWTQGPGKIPNKDEVVSGEHDFEKIINKDFCSDKTCSYENVEENLIHVEGQMTQPQLTSMAQDSAVFKHLAGDSKLAEDMDAVAHAKWANAYNRGGLDMFYIFNLLTKGGTSKGCQTLRCQDNMSRPITRDVNCQQNNRRPLCIMPSPLTDYEFRCPHDLNDSDGKRLEYCGDDVKPILVAKVVNRLVTYRHEFGAQYGATELNNKKNYIQALHDLKNSGEDSINMPDLYIDCWSQDTFTHSRTGDKVLTPFQVEACMRAGVQFDDARNVVKFPTFNCRCKCPEPCLKFNDPNAFNEPVDQCGMSLPPQPSKPENFSDDDRAFICHDGYECCSTDESHDYFHGLNKVTRNGVDHKGDQVCAVRCADEKDNNSYYSGNFWEVQASEVNKRKVWRDSLRRNNQGRAIGTKHSPGTTIKAKCVAKFCKYSKQDFNCASDHSNFQSKDKYPIGEAIEFNCNQGYCGGYKMKCVDQGPCKEPVWETTGECKPDYCVEPICEDPALHRDNRLILTGGPMRNQCNLDIQPSISDEPRRLYVGDRHECKCECDNLSSTSQCRSVSECRFDPLADGGKGKLRMFYNTQQLNQAQCKCNDPTCPEAQVIPFGMPMTVVGKVNADGRHPLGNFVNYQCDNGYDLIYTPTGEVLDSNTADARCARQCYRPPKKNKHCVKDHGYEHCHAVMDPLMCFCRPKVCPVHDLPPCFEYIDETSAKSTHWPEPGLNEIKVKCKPEGTFSENFYHQTVYCDYHNGDDFLSWSFPKPCYNMVCADPRGVYGAVLYSKATCDSFAFSMNLKHTCLEEDKFYHHSTKNDITKSIMFPENADTTVYDVKRFQFQMPLHKVQTETRYYVDIFDNCGREARRWYARYDMCEAKPIHTDFPVDNTVAEFVCRKGFKKYFNAEHARLAKNWGPLKGSKFQCTCFDGNWHCMHECRCEDYRECKDHMHDHPDEL